MGTLLDIKSRPVVDGRPTDLFTSDENVIFHIQQIVTRWIVIKPIVIYGGFLKWWYPTTIGFPTRNDHFGVFWGYPHFRKHPNGLKKSRAFPEGPNWSGPTLAKTANSRLHQVERERQRDLIRQLYHHFGQPLGSQKILKNNVGLSFFAVYGFLFVSLGNGMVAIHGYGFKIFMIDVLMQITHSAQFLGNDFSVG